MFPFSYRNHVTREDVNKLENAVEKSEQEVAKLELEIKDSRKEIFQAKNRIKRTKQDMEKRSVVFTEWDLKKYEQDMPVHLKNLVEDRKLKSEAKNRSVKASINLSSALRDLSILSKPLHSYQEDMRDPFAKYGI